MPHFEFLLQNGDTAAKFPPVKPPPWIRARPILHARGASWWLPLAVVGAALWCACSTRDARAPAVQRDAFSEPRVGLIYLTAVPLGALDLGTVNARCDQVRIVPSRQPVGLAQLDCSIPLLRRLIEERALSRGASALVGAVCPEHPDDASIECEARAIQLPPHSIGARAPESVLAPTELPAAATVFNATVWFASLGVPGSAQKPAPQPQEVSSQPVADRKLGVLQVAVSVPTSRDEAIKCIALAAKHFHATHFGTPSCVALQHPGVWACTSVLFAPELDERTIAGVR